jgi:hypothetical protein
MIMHATIQKPLDEILSYIRPDENVFVVGCGNCATKCHSGGEVESKEMAERLKSSGKKVAGWACTGSGVSLCKLSVTKKMLIEDSRDAAAKADSFLVLACGQGIHAVMDATDGGKVHPGCDTIFGGETINDNLIAEYCSLCGECVLENTGGLCPVTLCSKGLLNGPCGGAKNGKCEVDPNRDCGWQLIYERLKKIDSLDKMANFATPKNNARWSRPRSLSLGEGEATFRSLSGDRKIVSRA